MTKILEMKPVYAALAAERRKTADYLEMVIRRRVTDPMLLAHLLDTVCDVREGRHVQDRDHVAAATAATPDELED